MMERISPRRSSSPSPRLISPRTTRPSRQRRMKQRSPRRRSKDHHFMSTQEIEWFFEARIHY
jgi:hypothetical protein